MNLWSHHFSQNLSGFLPWVVRAEILTIFCSYFGRNDDFIYSWKEERPGCLFLFSNCNHNKKLWMTFGVLQLVFSHSWCSESVTYHQCKYLYFVNGPKYKIWIFKTILKPCILKIPNWFVILKIEFKRKFF